MYSQSKRIVSHFNHSALACDTLKTIQDEINVQRKTKKLVQDVPTRWNSKYHMLEVLVEQKRAVSIYINENSSNINIQNLNVNQWPIANIVKILYKNY